MEKCKKLNKKCKKCRNKRQKVVNNHQKFEKTAFNMENYGKKLQKNRRKSVNKLKKN